MSIARPGRPPPPCVIAGGRSGGLAVFAVPPIGRSDARSSRDVASSRSAPPPPPTSQQPATDQDPPSRRAQARLGRRAPAAGRLRHPGSRRALLQRPVLRPAAADGWSSSSHRMEMVFIATADASGDCDASLRAGSPGFLRVLDDRTLAYPEYRGNGVMASLGNLSENPHIGLLMIDFVEDLIGLHVNGRAHVLDNDDLRRALPRARRAGGGPTRRAVGRRRRRRGLHPLPQAHPADAAPAPEARLGHRRPRPQGRRLLRRPHAPAPPAGAIPAPRAPLEAAAGQRRAGACAGSGSAVRSVVEVSRRARMHPTRDQAADRHDDRDRRGCRRPRPSPRRRRAGAMPAPRPAIW